MNFPVGIGEEDTLVVHFLVARAVEGRMALSMDSHGHKTSTKKSSPPLHIYRAEDRSESGLRN